MDIFDRILESLELERELGVRTVEIDRALLVPPGPSPAAAPEPPPRPAAAPAPPSPAAEPPRAPVSGGDSAACDIAFLTGRPLSDRGMDAMRRTFDAMRKIRPDISVKLNERCRPKAIVLLGSDALLKRMPTARPIRGAWIVLDGVPAVTTFSPDFIFSHFQEGSPNMNKAKRSMWDDVKSAIARL